VSLVISALAEFSCCPKRRPSHGTPETKKERENNNNKGWTKKRNGKKKKIVGAMIASSTSTTSTAASSVLLRRAVVVLVSTLAGGALLIAGVNAAGAAAAAASSSATSDSTTDGDSSINVGFGTAALGGKGVEIVKIALEHGFRKFDTAEENEFWYDPSSVGQALREYFVGTKDSCQKADIRISTKIPPWELVSEAKIRDNAKRSRELLVGFCDDASDNAGDDKKFPLDVYYIHAPACWKGWHPKCNGVTNTLSLRDVWLALEAVVGLDKSAKRIGLSNVSPEQLEDIVTFVKERQGSAANAAGATDAVAPAPRLPDVVQNHADPIEPAKEVREICAKYGIEFVSYSTLGTQHQYRDNNNGNNPVLNSRVVKDLAAKYDKSTAEIVLSWALQNNMSIIPRSANREHIKQLSNLLKYRRGEGFLSQDDLAKIDSLKDEIVDEHDEHFVDEYDEGDGFDDDDDYDIEKDIRDLEAGAHDDDDDAWLTEEGEEDEDFINDDYEPGLYDDDDAIDPDDVTTTDRDLLREDEL